MKDKEPGQFNREYSKSKARVPREECNGCIFLYKKGDINICKVAEIEYAASHLVDLSTPKIGDEAATDIPVDRMEILTIQANAEHEATRSPNTDTELLPTVKFKKNQILEKGKIFCRNKFDEVSARASLKESAAKLHRLALKRNLI